MTPLGFKIEVNNSEANQDFDEIGSRLKQIQAQTEQLYEGPSREMKIRSEVSAMVKELSIGANPLNTFISTMDRLSESFKFALPVAIGVAALAEILKMEVAAKEGAVEFLEAWRDGMIVGKEASTKAIEAAQKKLEEVEQKYSKMGWLERIMLGMEGINAGRLAAQAREQIETFSGILDERAAALEHAKTESMSPDENIKSEGEVAQKRLEFEQRIADLRAKNQDATANQLVMQEKSAIDEIERHRAEKEKERLDREQKLQQELADQQNDDQNGHLNTLEQQQERLQQKIAQDPDGEDKLKDEIELGKVKKEIETEQARIAKEISDREKTQAQETARLKSQSTLQEFDLLSKEEKTLLLQQEADRVKFDLTRIDIDANDRLKDLIRLGQINKMMNELHKPEQVEKISVDSIRAMGGTLGGVNYSVANEASGRAEKQRDDMVGLLKMIALKPDLSQVESF